MKTKKIILYFLILLSVLTLLVITGLGFFFNEKDIALKTTLKVGKFLENEPDFQVVYTRKTDEFIELVNRPKIANKIDANLFVSIHCNSVKNFEPAGTETNKLASILLAIFGRLTNSINSSVLRV